MIPLRGQSLSNIDLASINGLNRVGSLRIDTDVANGRSTRNTLRPAPDGVAEEIEDEIPGSAATDTSMSESGCAMSARSLAGSSARGREVWNGTLSAVIGLQKRGLRGLMEGRRMRERSDGGRAGLGIA